MEYIESKRLGEGYYKTTLKNGLTVLVYPMTHKSAVFAMLSSGVGTTTLEFTVDGKNVKVPPGTAHFLEHKMFENKDGIDAFELFAKTGASANAYTSFDRTCYLFEASLNAGESLKTILQFVGDPYFTKKTVKKEQGIIGQEIKMYLDHPGWRQMFVLLGLLYKDHPVKYDLAGSVESIALITPELLYDFYDAFYNPSNMVLAVSGNITVEEVIEICEGVFEKRDWKRHETVTASCNEFDSIAGDYEETVMQVSAKQFCLGFKEIPFSKEERVKKEIALDILLDIIAGETSSLYRELYDNELIDSELSAEALSGEDYLCTLFSGESSDPDKAVARIKEEIERIKANGIDNDRFTECKRAYIGHIIGDFEDISAIAANLTYAYFKGVGVYDIMNYVETIEKRDVESMLYDAMREGYSALSVIVPVTNRETNV